MESFPVNFFKDIASVIQIEMVQGKFNFSTTTTWSFTFNVNKMLHPTNLNAAFSCNCLELLDVICTCDVTFNVA